jgi:hypothetical protein
MILAALFAGLLIGLPIGFYIGIYAITQSIKTGKLDLHHYYHRKTP